MYNNDSKIYPPSTRSEKKTGKKDDFPIQTDIKNISIEEYIDNPKSYLRRSLAKSEEVIEEFDVYFPTNMIPKWKLVLYSISTLGLYLVILAYRAILRWCYKNKCILPLVYVLQRGKMVVTNKGRILLWEQNVNERTYNSSDYRSFFKFFCPKICSPPTIHKVYSNSKSYKIDSIRQISQFYSSSSLLWCCHGGGYESGVEISFEEYNHNGHIGANSFVTTRSNSSMSGFLKRFQHWIDQSVTGGVEVINNIIGLTHKPHVFYIVSCETDIVRNGEAQTVLDDVNKLYAKVMSLLHEIPDVFIPNASIPKGTMYTTDRFTGVIIVDTDMSISIPPKWFQLLPEEEVLNSIGLVYKMSTMDYLYSFCTFGYYYYTKIEPKKFQRSAMVLTNKRFIIVDLNQQTGMIPAHLNDFEISVRCYMPKSINCGYIYSSSFQHLETAISGLGGTIHIRFPTLPGSATRTSYLNFAKSIHQIKMRAESKLSTDIENQISLDINNILATSKFTSEEEMLIDDYLISEIIEPLSSSEVNTIPFIDGEVVIEIIRGIPKWAPFCNFLDWIYSSKTSDNYNPINVCEKGKCCFPMLPFFLTCALRPFRNFNDIIITNNTIFQYIKERNEGIFGFYGPIAEVQPFFWSCDGSSIICQTDTSFMIAWTPIHTVNGHTVQYEYAKQEDWYSRICKDNVIGNICCPINDSTYDLVVHAGGLDFLSSGNSKDINRNNSLSLQRAEQFFNRIEVIDR